MSPGDRKTVNSSNLKGAQVKSWTQAWKREDSIKHSRTKWVGAEQSLTFARFPPFPQLALEWWQYAVPVLYAASACSGSQGVRAQRQGGTLIYGPGWRIVFRSETRERPFQFCCGCWLQDHCHCFHSFWKWPESHFLSLYSDFWELRRLSASVKWLISTTWWLGKCGAEVKPMVTAPHPPWLFHSITYITFFLCKLHKLLTCGHIARRLISYMNLHNLKENCDHQQVCRMGVFGFS